MEVRCIICDYDLRGLQPDGVCPECGTPIERSLQGDLLRYADQRWLRTVHRGLKITTWSVWTLLSACIAMPLLLIIGMVGQDIPALNVSFELMFMWVLIPVSCVVPFGIMIGLWIATTPEPREMQKDTIRPMALRIVSMAAVPMIGSIFIAGSNAAGLPVWVQWPLSVLGFITIVVHMTMFNDLLQALERRCRPEDEKRAKLLKKYRKDGVGCGVILLLIGVLVFVARLPAGGPRPGFGLFIVLLLWLVTLGLANGTTKRIAIERAIAEGTVNDQRPAVGA